MTYNSIWRDTYYTAATASLVYKIVAGGTVIYSGKAVRMPGEEEVRININKVCRNYLSSDIRVLLETTSASTINSDAYRTFQLTDEAGNVLETYGFLLDYDYEHNWTGGAEVLSLPINGHYVNGMMKPRTVMDSGHILTTYKSTGVYPFEVGCGDVLYYLNARGGWDAFVFEGNNTRTDKLTSYYTDREFDNTTLDFERNKYVSEIKTSWSLNSGYLTDEQSQLFAKHLLQTNKCYLHKMDEGWIKPVVITDNSVAYQTYQGNGRRLSNYKITVEESQSKIRR